VGKRLDPNGRPADVFHNIKMGLFLTALSIILTYFSPRELVPTLAPYHLQLGVMLFGLAISIAALATRLDRGMQSPQYLLVLGFWAAIVASHAMKLKFRWGLESLTLFGPLVAIYFLTTLNTFTLTRIKVVAGVLIGCAAVLGIQAILAYHTGYLGEKLLLISPTDFASYLGNRVRGFGILQDPNDFAQFLLVSFALLGLFWKKSRVVANLIILGPIGAILLYAAYLTFSRGGLLGLGAVLFFAIYRKGRRVVAFATGCLGTLALYLLRFTGGRDMGLEGGRLMAWGAGLSATVHHPLFGVGFGHFSDINDLTAHNSFVLCVTELGFFGYFFWMALLLVTFIGIAALMDLEVKTPEDQAFSAAVTALRAAMCAFLVTSWFLSRTYTETLYILLALSASLIHLRAGAIPPEKFHLRHWVPATVALEFASLVLAYLAVKARLL
jgi:putative inorganic carbon (hco3(-)) transporter